MGAYHLFQLGLAACTVGVVVWRVRALCFRTSFHAGPLVAEIRSQPEDLAQTLSELKRINRDSFIVRATGVAFDKELGSDVILSEIRSEARAGLELLKGLARLATASGLLGMVGYLLWMMEGEHGLVGLQAGLPEKIAAQRGLLAMAIGACVALFAHSARGMLAPIALRTVQDATRVVRALEPMLAAGLPKDGPEKAPMIKSDP